MTAVEIMSNFWSEEMMEYRCRECGKPILRSNVKDLIVNIRCGNCRTANTFLTGRPRMLEGEENG